MEKGDVSSPHHRLVTPRRRISGPLVSDTFTRANSGSTMGNAETGQTWLYPVGGSTFGITSNRAGQFGGGGVALIDTALADCTVQVDLVAGLSGLCFRDSGGSNHWIVQYSGKVYKKVSGSYALQTTLSPNGLATFKVVMSGSTLQFYRSGSLIGTITDSFNSTATRHGLYGGDTAAIFDNFTVTA